MAFNPLHDLRKHQKYVMAGLVLVAMFTFVLSSGAGGKGDLFSQIGDWATGSSSNTLISVGGKSYDGQQVQHVRYQRMLASKYMELATAFATEGIARRASEGLKKLEGESQQAVANIVETRMYATMGSQMAQMFGQQFVQQYADRYRSILENSNLYKQMLRSQQASAEKKEKKDELATLVATEYLLDLDARAMQRQPGESYFEGKLNDDPDYETMSNFLLWQYEADQLGIKLSQADIKQAIAVETFFELTPENAGRINEMLKREVGGYTLDGLYDAIGMELRGRLARASLMGMPQRMRRAFPAVNTPQQLWELYKDARTSIFTGQIALPVDSFLAEVKASPTEADLKELFAKYKTFTPSPERSAPAFKDPRRIMVEWVSADAAAPFYQDAAKKLAPVSLAVAQIGSGAAGLMGGDPTGITEAIAALAPVAFPDAPLYAELQRYRDNERGWENTLQPYLHDSSVLRPENFAVAIGAAIGAAGTGAPARLVGPLAFEGRAIMREVRVRGRIGGTEILTGALDPAGLSLAGVPQEVLPKPLGLDALRGQLQEKVVANYAKKLLTDDSIGFAKELAKLGKETDKAAVKKYLDEFVKARGWGRGSTAEPRDLYNIIDDPGLSTLKEAYVRGQGRNDLLLRGFGPAFFQDQTRYNQTLGVYTPQMFPSGFGDDKQYYYWRSDDRPERVPSFEKAKPQIEAAWKYEEARKLAKAAADKLAKQAKEAQADIRKLRDLAAANGNREFFELGPMAKRMPVPTLPDRPRQYTTYTVPPDRIAYAGDAFVAKLLDLRNDAIGATTVVADQPQKNYYVASLLRRDEPLPDEFPPVYKRSMVTATDFDELLAELGRDSLRVYRNELIKLLRAEAKVTVNPDAIKGSKDKTQDAG